MKSYVKDTVINSEQGDDSTSHCCICLEDYKPNDVMGVLPCEWVNLMHTTNLKQCV